MTYPNMLNYLLSQNSMGFIQTDLEKDVTSQSRKLKVVAGSWMGPRVYQSTNKAPSLSNSGLITTLSKGIERTTEDMQSQFRSMHDRL